jgi:hypothetical protein
MFIPEKVTTAANFEVLMDRIKDVFDVNFLS